MLGEVAQLFDTHGNGFRERAILRATLCRFTNPPRLGIEPVGFMRQLLSKFRGDDRPREVSALSFEIRNWKTVVLRFHLVPHPFFLPPPLHLSLR